jgi:hypothetical protein
VVFEHTLNLWDEGLEAQALEFQLQPGDKHEILREGRTCRAEIMCSGAMVFLDSFSHISFASEERRWMNSTPKKGVNINATGIPIFFSLTYTTFNHQISRFFRT